MRKLVVYITRVLNVKLALSFYISVYMQNQCLIFYQHKQWIQITSISHQNAYKEVSWLKFQGGAYPPRQCAPQIVRRAQIERSAQIVRRAQIVCRAETEPPSTMMLSHFSGGNPV